MRWFWIDRFTEFVSGSHAYGLKNVALDEEVVDEYSPGWPMLPSTLIIEGMAQLGGILVAEHFGFEKRVVLAKVSKAIFHRPARTSEQLHYKVTLESIQEEGATVTCTSHCEGTLQAEIDLMFACLEDGKFVEGMLFKPGDLRSMLGLMYFFHVAVDADGNPVPMYKNL